MDRMAIYLGECVAPRLELEAEESQAAEAAKRLGRSPGGAPSSAPGEAGLAANEQTVKDLLKLLPSSR